MNKSIMIDKDSNSLISKELLDMALSIIKPETMNECIALIKDGLDEEKGRLACSEKAELEVRAYLEKRNVIPEGLCFDVGFCDLICDYIYRNKETGIQKIIDGIGPKSKIIGMSFTVHFDYYKEGETTTHVVDKIVIEDGDPLGYETETDVYLDILGHLGLKFGETYLISPEDAQIKGFSACLESVKIDTDGEPLFVFVDADGDAWDCNISEINQEN